MNFKPNDRRWLWLKTKEYFRVVYSWSLIATVAFAVAVRCSVKSENKFLFINDRYDCSALEKNIEPI